MVSQWFLQAISQTHNNIQSGIQIKLPDEQALGVFMFACREDMKSGQVLSLCRLMYIKNISLLIYQIYHEYFGPSVYLISHLLGTLWIPNSLLVFLNWFCLCSSISVYACHVLFYLLLMLYFTYIMDFPVWQSFCLITYLIIHRHLK